MTKFKKEGVTTKYSHEQMETNMSIFGTIFEHK